MKLAEVIERLAAARLNVNGRMVDYAIRMGHVDPIPYDPTGARDFTEDDVEALTIHFRTRRPRRGRRPRLLRGGLVGSLVDSLG